MTEYRKVILDASAIIALINQEKGCEIVEEHMHISIMSTVNVSEVIKFLIDRKDYTIEEAKEIVESLLDETHLFDNQQAYSAAQLYIKTKSLGLSLADRACLALSLYTGYPVITADRIWQELECIDVNIILIR